MRVIYSEEAPLKNFGKKNMCAIVDELYFRCIIRDKAIFTYQLEHASTYETKEHAEIRCQELNHSGKTTYLSTMEIK